MAAVDPIVTGEAEGPPTPDELRDREIMDPETPEQATEAMALDPSTPLIDQAVAAAAPPVGTATETGSPPAVAPTTPTEAGAGSFAASMEAAGHASDKAQHENEISDVDQQRLAQQTQDAEDDRVRREMDALAQADARSEYQKKVDDADEKVRGFKFHDYYDNPKHQSRVLDKFAAFLGGLGNLGGQAPGTPNRALDSIENSIRADHEEQLAYLNSSKYLADKQREGYTDLLKQQGVDRQQAELDYANKKLATADKFAELAQTARGKSNYDAAMIEVAKLKKSAYDDQRKVFSEIEREKLEEARARYLANKAHRGSGTGGSTGDAAYAKLVGQLQDHPEWGPKEQAQAALAAGVPLNAKAGHNSLGKAQQDARMNARTDLSGDKQVAAEATAFSKGHRVDAIAKKQQELGAILKTLDDNRDNPLAQKLALEQAVSAARGGAASRQALGLALSALGGSLDNFEGTIQHIVSGGLGSKQYKNFYGFLNGQLGAAQAEGKDASDAFDQYVSEQPPEKQEKLRREKSRLFSGLHGFATQSEAAPPAQHAVKQAQDRLERLGAVRIE